MPRKLSFSTISMLAVTLAFAASASAQVRCEEPTHGDGGTTYKFQNEPIQQATGIGSARYAIYEPDPSEVTDALPVVAFLHGYNLSATPTGIEAFITHLVKKGHIVIWPKYMAYSLFDSEEYDPRFYAPHAAAAIKAALQELQDNPEHAQPRSTHGQVDLAIIGHSAGAITAANLAADYATYELPAPRALVCMNAGQGGNRPNTIPVPITTTNIPAETYTLVIAGDSDDLGIDGDVIWNIAGQIDNNNKDWILLHSDSLRFQRLVANHFAPLGVAPDAQGAATMPLDCLDWYGYWKWATALIQLGFAQDGDENADYYRALSLGYVDSEGRTHREAQSFMGEWVSNFRSIRPVAEPSIGDTVQQ